MSCAPTAVAWRAPDGGGHRLGTVGATPDLRGGVAPPGAVHAPRIVSPSGALRGPAAAGGLRAGATVLLLLGLLLVGNATPASAHATLVDGRPADRSALDSAPAEVSLTFSEPVTVPSGGLRVLDAQARRVDLGPVDTGDPTVVAVALPTDLPDGAYVVSYRVISADSHPVGGVRTFTVGEGVEEVAATTLEAIADDGTSVAARRVGQLLRGLGYGMLLLAAGAAVSGWLIVRRPGDRAVAHRVAVWAALAGVVVSLLGVPVQAVAVTGEVGAAWSGVSLWETATSSFGVASIVRSALLAVLATVLLAGLPGGLVAAVAAGALSTVVLDGHQRSVPPTWLLVTGDLVHVAAAAVWFGGLVVLAVVLSRRTSRPEAVPAAGLVARFSGVALVAAVLVAVGGAAMAWPLVGGPAALLGTAYGRTLSAKLAAVGVVVLVAAYNRFRLVPAIVAGATPSGSARGESEPAADSTGTPSPADAGTSVALGIDDQQRRATIAWSQLQRTLRLEVALLSGVLLLTGVLATTQPAVDAAGFGGIFETTTPLGAELELDLVVDPSVVGRNTIHLYVLDATGRPSQAVEDLRVELTFVPAGVGPIRIEPFFAGPGHWIATTEDLSFAGDWEVRVIAGLDRFTEHTAIVTVPVAP